VTELRERYARRNRSLVQVVMTLGAGDLLPELVLHTGKSFWLQLEWCEVGCRTNYSCRRSPRRGPS
jgi:hypothetical protein